jgi:acyl-CoA thioesterase YciA
MTKADPPAPAPGDLRRSTSGQPTGELRVRIVAMPSDTNPSGDIFGGWIMGLMDQSAGIAARDRARGRVVTASVSSLNFLHPVKVGAVVCCYIHVIGIGRTSITLEVETWVVRDQRTDRLRVTEAKFVMVAVSADGRPRLVDTPDVPAGSATPHVAIVELRMNRGSRGTRASFLAFLLLRGGSTQACEALHVAPRSTWYIRRRVRATMPEDRPSERLRRASSKIVMNVQAWRRRVTGGSSWLSSMSG